MRSENNAARSPMIYIEPVIAIRGAFLVGSALVLTVFFLPVLRDRLLDYGPRSSVVSSAKDSPHNSKNYMLSTLDHLATYRVPHAYFTHFYIASVVGSWIWAQQILTRGPLFEIIAQSSDSSHRASMSMECVRLAWVILCLQGSRRLYESLAFSRRSKSSMWVGHWALGLLFYTGMGLAIWVEGIPAIEEQEYLLPWSRSNPNSWSGRALISTINSRSLLFVPLFLFASGLQYKTHQYLYNLPKRFSSSPTTAYTRPTHPTFSLSVTPHYFFEILIYVSLTFLSAPSGHIINWTVASGLVFVTVNLGVTAAGTRQFWIRTWGQDSVAGKARMIPYVW